ncbi:MAG: mandelate racemase/muconate lactonizing enzyme family protein [Candidatus Bathyarchaeia archaeon]
MVCLRITEVNAVSLERYFIPSHWGRLLVRVKTDEGFAGYGESGEDSRWGVGEALIRNWAEQHIVGSDPLETRKILCRIWFAMKHFGRNGITMGTLSALDFALLDLKGKILGVPVYELLGGKYRDRIRVYCDTGRPRGDDPESHVAVTREALKAGFDALKFDLDIGFEGREARGWEPYNEQLRNDELRWMVAVTDAVRNAVGENVELMVDLHGSYNTASAVKIAKALEPYNLTWLEEPVPAENVDAMREVKQSTSTPICAGENLYSAWGFKDLLEKQAVSVVEPDVNKCGGILEAQKVAGMAALQYIPVAPHNTSTPVGTLAACHLCAAIPNFLSLEWHGSTVHADDPRYAPWEKLIEWDGPIIKDGYVTLPKKPGLGFELNEEACLEASPKAEALFR